MSIKLGLKKLKKYIFSIIFMLMVLLLSIGLFSLFLTSYYNPVEDSRTVQLKIDDAYFKHRETGSTLFIDAKNRQYICRMPRSAVSDAVHATEESPLVGQEVTAMLINRKSVLGKDRVFIIDLRSENTVYYDVETELNNLSANRIRMMILTPCLFLAAIGFIFLTCFVNGIISIKKKQKNIPPENNMICYFRPSFGMDKCSKSFVEQHIGRSLHIRNAPV